MLEKAKAIRQHLVERSPEDIGYQRSLAEVINDMGYVFYKRQNYPAALAAFQEVQKTCQSLLEHIQDGPKPVKVLDWLAQGSRDIGHHPVERRSERPGSAVV